jgi:hypothetical protein
MPRVSLRERERHQVVRAHVHRGLCADAAADAVSTGTIAGHGAAAAASAAADALSTGTVAGDGTAAAAGARSRPGANNRLFAGARSRPSTRPGARASEAAAMIV